MSEDRFVFSVDLEPNKDGSLTGVPEAMEWFDRTIARGTVFATHRIATELPGVIATLAESHRIGVHVHPREFGHPDDQLAVLGSERQREIIARTRQAVSEAAGLGDHDVVAFRAGRHSLSPTTLDVLDDLGFAIDASVHVNYPDTLPAEVLRHTEPFTLDSGLFEVPTTFRRAPWLSRPGLRAFPDRIITATAHTLRTDRRGCSGLEALAWLVGEATVFSMYMHPYDATRYHGNLANTGAVFRDRVEALFADVPKPAFVGVNELLADRQCD